MPDLRQLVITAAEYKVMLDVPNAVAGYNAYVLKTAETLSYEIQVEDETVHAISTRYPIAEMSNAKSYRGSLGLQAGELNAILLLAGLNDATELIGCTLAVSAIKGGFVRVFEGVNFNTERLSIRAKDKQTIATSDWKGLGVNNA